MSAKEAVLTVLLGNLIVLVPMLLNGHAGARYGIVLQAAGGPMNATGDAHRAPQRKPGLLEQYTIGRTAGAPGGASARRATAATSGTGGDWEWPTPGSTSRCRRLGTGSSPPGRRSGRVPKCT